MPNEISLKELQESHSGGQAVFSRPLILESLQLKAFINQTFVDKNGPR